MLLFVNLEVNEQSFQAIRLYITIVVGYLENLNKDSLTPRFFISQVTRLPLCRPQTNILNWSL